MVKTCLKPYLLPNPAIPPPRINRPYSSLPSPQTKVPSDNLSSLGWMVHHPLSRGWMAILSPYHLQLLSFFYLRLPDSWIYYLLNPHIHCFHQDISILPRFHPISHFLLLHTQDSYVLYLQSIPHQRMESLYIQAFSQDPAQDGGTNKSSASYWIGWKEPHYFLLLIWCWFYLFQVIASSPEISWVGRQTTSIP